MAKKVDKILLLQLKKYQGGKMPLSEYRKEMGKLFELNIAKTLEPTMAIIQNREGLRKALRLSRDSEMRGDTDVV